MSSPSHQDLDTASLEDLLVKQPVLMDMASRLKAAESYLPADVPPSFLRALFNRGATEDVSKLNPQALAFLCSEAYAHLEQRSSGVPSIRLVDPDVSMQGGDDTTVIEIINDDMPFLLDSVLAELNEAGLELQLVLHPIVLVERADDGSLMRFGGEATTAHDDENFSRESLIHLHVVRIDSPEVRDHLLKGLAQTLNDVAHVVADWAGMRQRMVDAIAAFRHQPADTAPANMLEAIQFLEWLADDNFTFLGLREYRFPKGDATFEPVEASGLGLLRDPAVKILRRGNELVTMTPEIRQFLEQPAALIITKANVKSRVHRRVHMDYIGIKQFDEAGTVVGELRLVGLFTSTAYTRSTRSIPYLRDKVEDVIRRASLDEMTHSGKALRNILESYPRDELFQIDVPLLETFAREILTLYERPRVRIFPRTDRFDRFVSVIVYVPREKYDTEARGRIGALLARVYEGRLSAAYPSYPEGPLARVHFIIGRYEGATPQPDRGMVEAAIESLVRSWPELLREVLSEQGDGARARRLAAKYGRAFTAGYRDAFSPRQAVDDIRILERLTQDKPLSIDLYRRPRDENVRASLKVFSYGSPMPLTDRVPVLEGMGFRVVNERTYRIEAEGWQGQGVWLHDMTLERARGGTIDLERLGEKLEAGLYAVLRGEAESDGFNGLILEAGLGWREVMLVRALARYLRQVKLPYSLDYVWQTLVAHGDVSAQLVALFHTRFDPHLTSCFDERRQKVEEHVQTLLRHFEAITSLDEDRIFRRFLNLIQSLLRTNFYQLSKEGRLRETLSFKIASRELEALPEPRPLYEISVYSPRVEGVHLRFGRVARGGLRWSDRPQDFRTEVLGLVKAQQVKNAVIVPVGAKGGFVPLKLPAGGTREAVQDEGTTAYKLFVSSLLQLTDNIKGQDTLPPEHTVCWDSPDPYLVVAADKGTATFSDTANALSVDHGFWLDDAFASGGSAGYDHKKMGITARGAWEAVKRHFREMNRDIQSEPFTVAGVGDMSGDVFGNGMLLSPFIRLQAAFDHRDIFLDPDPDPARSFAERERMFALPRSSWADYNRELISRGGGIFSRSLKKIPLSEPVQTLLGLAKEEATPAEVMTAILTMPVDLLWFGGIGTYVRAMDETDAEVGDRANDAHRVTASCLRCLVIGEGANLGMTQKARIEAALHGVRLNTDAIDNSAGVNSSDVEVNIKIAMTTAEQRGLLTRPDRNAFLASMTSEVAQLVLKNNKMQSLCLSMAQLHGVDDLNWAKMLMRTLEGRGLLNRRVEFLPTDEQLELRRQSSLGLTRPELAVLLAYSKLSFYDDLLATSFPDDAYLSQDLLQYFPKAMQQRFRDMIEGHRLRREIISTHITNDIINMGGVTLLARLGHASSEDPAAVAKAFVAVRDGHELLELSRSIEALAGSVRGDVQLALYAHVQEHVLRAMKTLLMGSSLSETLDVVVGRLRTAVRLVSGSLETLLPQRLVLRLRDAIQVYENQGVALPLARSLAVLPVLHPLFDLLDSADTSDLLAKFSVLHGVQEAFGLGELLDQAAQLPAVDAYDQQALGHALSQIVLSSRTLAQSLVEQGFERADAAVEALKARTDVNRVLQVCDDIRSGGWSLARALVVADMLGKLSVKT